MLKENLIVQTASSYTSQEKNRLNLGQKKGIPNRAVATINRILLMLNNANLCGGCANLTVGTRRKAVGCLAREGQIRNVATDAGAIVITCPFYRSLSAMIDPEVTEVGEMLIYTERKLGA